MNAFKQGTWTRPTTTDSQLLLGLGASGAVVHNARSHPDPPVSFSEQLDRNDVMASLENFQSSLDGYLQSLEHNPQIAPEAYGGIATSDSFLYGILGGSGNSEFPANLQADTQPTASFDPKSVLETPDVPVYNTTDPFQSQPGFQNPTETSDFSSLAPGVPDMSLPFTSAGPPPALTESQTIIPVDDAHAAFLWDNFLRELGIPNANNQSS
jgi:hypothetical protein